MLFFVCYINWLKDIRGFSKDPNNRSRTVVIRIFEVINKGHLMTSRLNAILITIAIIAGLSCTKKTSSSGVNTTETSATAIAPIDIIDSEKIKTAQSGAVTESIESSVEFAPETQETPILAPAPVLSITSAFNITSANEENYSLIGECSDNDLVVDILIGISATSVACTDNTFFISNYDISSIDDGNITITVSQTNSESTVGSAVEIVTKQTSVPTITITNSPGISQANVTSYAIHGSCSENDRTVSLAFGGSLNFSALCSAGFWSLNNLDVSSLSDSATISLTADHSNSDAISASQASASIAKDTLAPTVTITQAIDINSDNQTSYQIAGTCSEDAQIVTVQIGSLSFSPICTSGAWATGFQDVSSLEEGSLVVSADHKSSTEIEANTAEIAISKSTVSPTVTGLSVPTTLADSAQLVWTLVDPVGSIIEDYTIQYRIKNTSTWLTVVDGISIDTSYTLSDLSPSTSYEFRVKVKYFESKESTWSETAIGETKPEDPLFDSPNKAMNVGGATTAQVVAFEDDTNITLNGVALKTLAKGESHLFNTAQFDVIDANKPIYTAGRRTSGNNGDQYTANMTFIPASWSGKNFSFNTTRYNTQKLAVYAIQDSEVNIYSGSDFVTSMSIAAGTGGVLSWSQYGSFQVSSTGTILAFHYSNHTGTYFADPKPLLPSYTEIIGIPSKSMRLTADSDGTFYNLFHSNSATESGSLNRADSITINPKGTSTLYQSKSLLIKASKEISGASFADSDGYCASVFLPTNLMKHKYAINVDSDYVAFASKASGTIAIYKPDQVIGVDTPFNELELSRTEGEDHSPYKAYMNVPLAGYRFISTVPMAAWYQATGSTGSSPNDETILYGTD